MRLGGLGGRDVVELVDGFSSGTSVALVRGWVGGWMVWHVHLRARVWVGARTSAIRRQQGGCRA